MKRGRLAIRGPRLVVVVVCAAAYAELPAPEQAAIDRISADSLRTNLSYLASDALEGRAWRPSTSPLSSAGPGLSRR
jgi:hypothetical protein